jgi:hypothetical protein
MPDVNLRHAWPVAQLEATLRNMMGGKRQRERKLDDDPPLQPHELYSALELLPWFARPDWAEEAAGLAIPPDAAKDFLKHRRDMPDWVIAIAPIDAIRRAAGTITA